MLIGDTSSWKTSSVHYSHMSSEGCEKQNSFLRIAKKSAPYNLRMMARFRRHTSCALKTLQRKYCDADLATLDVCKVRARKILRVHANGQALSFQEGCQMPGVRSACGNSR